ncbi:MAG: DUF3365 domain-containing protein [Verrucomicrobia bacterium]|nr:DUF3365 domain-containing protein [Verrucomicrobiota bacterium]
MKLLKFNLIFIPLLAISLIAIAHIARALLFEESRQHVIQNARIIMEASLSSRTYTTKQVAPLLQQKDFKVQSAMSELRKTVEQIPATPDPSPVKDPRAKDRRNPALGQQRALDFQQQILQWVKDRSEQLTDADFPPQSVPAFAATEIFGYLREKFPDYFYKEATLNPTNPRDRATDWESDVVNHFRSGQAEVEFIGTRETSTTGKSLFLARPIKVDNVTCLACHSTPDKAPPSMIKLYGSDNGFNWKLNDIIGAQIVSVPLALPLDMAEKGFQTLLVWLGGAFGGLLIGANLGVILATRSRREAERAGKPLTTSPHS